MEPTREEERMDIEKMAEEAKALEARDDLDKAVAILDKIFDHYAANKDIENAVFYFNKILRILKRESEFYRAASRHLKTAGLYLNLGDKLNAARHFSRAGTLYTSVNAFNEAAGAYEKAGDMFVALEGEFFVEAAKHYKLAALKYINLSQRQLVDYSRACDKAMNAYRQAEKTSNLSHNHYLLHMTNFYADLQDALNRNGFYREEKAIFVKKMDSIRENAREKKGGLWRYTALTGWKYTCMYGENALLWVGWICVHVLSFGFIFYHFRLVMTAKGAFLSFAESVYFAINIFATLGFGSYELVSDTARLVVALDVMTGYFMMALLITIFARQLTR